MERIRRRLGALTLAGVIAVAAFTLTPATAFANTVTGSSFGSFCATLASTIAAVEESYPDSFIKTYLLRSLNAAFDNYCQ